MLNSVVCLKEVPDTADAKVDPKTGNLIREGIPSIINPYDIHAVEAAVRLKEQHGGMVIILCMGPPKAKESVKKALGVGADLGILVSDGGFAGSDTLATSYILSEAIRKLMQEYQVDLIFCGKQAIDGDTAQVGPGIAARLRIAQLTYVTAINGVDVEQREIEIVRKLEGGSETLLARLPALITVEKSINEVRYSSFVNMLQAARSEIQVWNKTTLGLDLAQIGLKGSPTTVSKIFTPPAKQGGKVRTGEPGPLVKELAGELLNHVLVMDR
ncbi:MAG TPA: electron transfer flavoprotein subunit beta/FixA family protein [Bacillota bacterium]|nr:electron transfer flavoprotein subunit beta/FixA family protein [Bacillota bacterium]